MRDLIRPVLILISGTAGAQAITLLLSPVLSRLYSPSDFGFLAVFVSLTSIFGVLACTRLDYAIPVAETDREAASVLRTAVETAGILAAILLVVFLSAGKPIATAFGQPALAPFLPLISITVLSMGVFQSLVQWNSRLDKFGLTANAQLARSVVTNIGQLAGSLVGAQGAGLVAGHFLGQLTASSRLASKSSLLTLLRSTKHSETKQVRKKYREFIIFGTPQALLNSVSQNLPSLLFTFFISPAAAGIYVLAQRMLAAPANLLGESVRQALYPKLARSLQEGDEFALSLASRMILVIGAVVLIPVVMVVWQGPALFVLVLGDQWLDAGKMARFLALSTGVSLMNIPSACLIQILRMQRWHVLYEVVYVTVRVSALTFGAVRGDALLAVALFAAAGICFNMIMISYPLILLRRRTNSRFRPH